MPTTHDDDIKHATNLTTEEENTAAVVTRTVPAGMVNRRSLVRYTLGDDSVDDLGTWQPRGRTRESEV
jgi:hypothetical protein